MAILKLNRYDTVNKIFKFVRQMATFIILMTVWIPFAYPRPNNLKSLRELYTRSSTANTQTSNAASASQDLATNNTLIILFDGLVKIINEYFYAIDSEINTLTKSNSALINSQRTLQKKMESVNSNVIQKILTHYVGYYDLDGEKQPDTSNTENTNEDELIDIPNYLDYLKNTDDVVELLKSSDKKVLKNTLTNKDSALFVHDTMQYLGCVYNVKSCLEEIRSGQYTGDDLIKKTNECRVQATSCKVLEKNLMGDNQQNITLPNNLQPTYNALMTQIKLCPPFKKADPTESPDEAETCIAKNVFPVKQKLLQLILSDSNNNNPSDFESARKKFAEGDAYYNAQSLLQPLVFNSNDNADSNENSDNTAQEAAKMFVNNISQLAKLPSIDPPLFGVLLTDTEKENYDNAKARASRGETDYVGKIEKEQDKYRRLMHTLIATKNLVMSNFYQLYTERLEQNGLKEMGLLDNNQHPIKSPLQLEAYLANRRLSQKWQEDMATVPPAVVERETLFLLSEMYHQAFQNQMLQERILTVLSLIALQNMHQPITDAKGLRQTISRNIESVLNNTSQQNAVFQNGDTGSDSSSTLSQTGGSGSETASSEANSEVFQNSALQSE